LIIGPFKIINPKNIARLFLTTIRIAAIIGEGIHWIFYSKFTQIKIRFDENSVERIA